MRRKINTSSLNRKSIKNRLALIIMFCPIRRPAIIIATPRGQINEIPMKGINLGPGSIPGLIILNVMEIRISTIIVDVDFSISDTSIE